jgi:osmotically-inducible protein OsmY
MTVTISLKEKVDENLLRDSRVGDYPIEVVDNNGVVTLIGEAPSLEVSMAAESIARQTEGVITVINEIVVKGKGLKGVQGQPPISPR